ncbi:MAG: hypothetical protein QE273_18455 [Verrucomicrobiales bacterium]|jgi:hypothetical protein|nr:hypothetical protein [Verrucomicrobiales bacterium]
MKRFTALTLAAAMPLGSVCAAGIDLPEWESTETPASYYLGGGLWPKSLIPDATAASAQPGAPVEGRGEGTLAGGLAVTDLDFVGPPAPGRPLPGTTVAATAAPTQFFGPAGDTSTSDPSLQRVKENPDGTFDVPEEVVEVEAYEPLPPLEGDLADLYFAHAPVEYLVDPQRLLTEQKSNDIMRFLEFHADESKFRIYLMVIGDNQKVPEGTDIKALHQKWFSDEPTALMLYYREKPELTELVFNDPVRNSLPKSVFDRILQNCLREGAVAELAPDQVEKMAIELSIQLYWLSRLMEKENPEHQSLVAASSVHEMIASEDAPELLREYAPGIFIDETSKMLSFVLTFVVVLGGLALIGLIGWVVMWWRGRESLSGEPLLFPEFRLPRRLGGEYCGGGFVGMSFELNEGAS